MDTTAKAAQSSFNRSVDECEEALAAQDVPELATIHQVAKAISLSYDFIWNQIQCGALKSIRLGRRIRLLRGDVAIWLAKHR